MNSGTHAKKRPLRGKGSSSMPQSQSDTSQSARDTRGHVKHRKWKDLVAKTTFLEESSVKVSKHKTKSSRHELRSVKICLDKWKTVLLEIHEKREDFEPLESFRRIVRIVRTILKVAKALKSDPKRDLGEGICRSYLEIIEGYMMMKNKTFFTSLPTDTGPGLFDPSVFKANKEIQISKEVRNILSLRCDERTPYQLQTLLYACQTLSAFAELPIHMQEAICKVAWHQSLAGNKIIVKQGHLPENYYIIMSGTVTVLSESDPTNDGPFTSLATLRRGHSFGDYQRIFMGRSKKGEEPSHIKFCRTLDFLAGFPVDSLIDCTANCMFHYFRRGTVIVKDSRESDWIYIVVSGMCEVLLNLEAATPKLTGKQIDAGVSPVEMLAYLTEDRFCKSQYAYKSPQSRLKGWDETLKERPNSCQTLNENRRRNIARHPNSRSVKSALSQCTNTSFTMSSFPLEETEITESYPSSNSSLNQVSEFTTRKQKLAKKQVFVRIDFLHPRRVFGLSNLDFDNTGEPYKDSASVSLVSRGAECVMISKKFFASHAREPTKRWIRQNVLPYPSKNILQQSLQQKVNWNAYKSDILHKVTNNTIS